MPSSRRLSGHNLSVTLQVLDANLSGVLAVSCVRLVAGEAQLENLAVYPAWQGRGLGCRLLAGTLQVNIWTDSVNCYEAQLHISTPAFLTKHHFLGWAMCLGCVLFCPCHFSQPHSRSHAGMWMFGGGWCPLFSGSAR